MVTVVAVVFAAAAVVLAMRVTAAAVAVVTSVTVVETPTANGAELRTVIRSLSACFVTP